MRKNSGRSFEQRVYTATTQNSKRKKNRKRKKLIRFSILGIGVVAIAFVVLFALKGAKESENNFEAEPQTFVNIGPPYVVALDAGHGGADVGALGVIQELELTERTVGILYSLLENDENFTPVLCREIGEGASVEQRAKAANAAKASLLLSIHGNSDPACAGSGFECYPVPPGRNNHTESFWIASLLSQEMGAAGSRLRGEAGARFLYYQEGSSTEKIVVEASDTSERELKSFGVLEKSKCPAVLVEQCFITNEEDVAQFGNEDGCRRAAESYYKAICKYFNVSNE